ncbi:MAG: hypothetical protein GX564_06015 [Oligosphaeraceae bacterium]|nr:hypothetical protein [Oligosphaeraceae bacterium]
MSATACKIRPYQFLCLICRLGRQGQEPYYFADQLDELQSRLAANRHCVLRLCCEVESTFRFQNPGAAADTPEGKSFNLRRDLTILQRLGLLPGAEIPAGDLLRAVLRPETGILTTADICGFPAVTGPAWKGCRYAGSGNFERGRERALETLLPGRSSAELRRCKRASAAAVSASAHLRIRPHHLLCMSCFTGACRAGDYQPIPEDNLYEAVENCRANPEVLIELVSGPCMICFPCVGYDPASGLCDAAFGMGLRDQKKDLDTLQLLGLDYGAVLPAWQLFQLVYERIPDQGRVCAFNTGRQTQEAWSICQTARTPPEQSRYRQAAADQLGIRARPGAEQVRNSLLKPEN